MLTLLRSLVYVVFLGVVVVSTTVPTGQPSAQPVGSPTSMPTPIAVTRITIRGSNILSGITPFYALNQTKTQTVYINNLVKYMQGVTSGQIHLLQINTTNPTTVTHPMLRMQSVSTATIIWSATFDTFQVDADTPAAAKNTVQTSLAAAVVSGNFLTSLKAADQGVFSGASVYSLSIDDTYTYDVLRTAAPSFRPTKSPTTPSWQENSIHWIKHDITLAGFVIFVLAVVFLYCLCGVGMAMYYRLERQAITKEQVMQRHIIQPRISLQDRARMRQQGREEEEAYDFENVTSGNGEFEDDLADNLSPAQRARLKLKKYASMTSPSNTPAPESPGLRESIGVNSPTPAELKAKSLSRSKSRDRLRSVNEVGSPVPPATNSSVLRGAVLRMQQERNNQRDRDLQNEGVEAGSESPKKSRIPLNVAIL